LRLPEKTELRKVIFAASDFGAALWNGIWLQRCFFDKSIFDKASVQKIADHGNLFTNCTFSKASFREAVIGFKGSQFQNCTFDRVDFRRAGFIRPEFSGCIFSHCRLDGCDLNGSSFERCEFVGPLNEVWFRGGFPHPNDVSQYGDPRPNQMLDVSFEKARLRDVFFSNSCVLSSVKLPDDGRCMLVSQWQEKLVRLQNELERWPQVAKEAGCAFVSTNLVHARIQNWFIVNRDDLEAEFGSDVAIRIWSTIAMFDEQD
jgi:uncharacterized protein YjbI with pentapeptide repeats